jgi:hypothetical protein
MVAVGGMTRKPGVQKKPNQPSVAFFNDPWDIPVVEVPELWYRAMRVVVNVG